MDTKIVPNNSPDRSLRQQARPNRPVILLTPACPECFSERIAFAQPRVDLSSIGIVDDTPRDREVIGQYLKQYSHQHPLQYQARQFEDGAALLENYQSNFDVIFLDIQMERPRSG